MDNLNIKLVDTKDEIDSPLHRRDDFSQISQASSSKIAYGAVDKPQPNYLKREGDFQRGEEDDVPDILNSDYPQFVEEHKTLDSQINSFEAYRQIYSAMQRHQNSDITRIRRHFGYSEANGREMNH